MINNGNNTITTAKSASYLGNVGLLVFCSSITVAIVNAGVKLGHEAAQNWATLGLRGRPAEGGGQSAALFM